MMVLVIPIAISVHTVVSFVFSMTLQPMWHSTIFGPYFVVGAIFSGIAALIIAMLIFRKAYRLEAYLKDIHFRYLGQLLLVMSLLWFYFTFAEYLTAYYGGEPEEMKVFWSKFLGRFRWQFWAMFTCNFLVPILCLTRLKKNTVKRVLIASITIVIGMWLERYIIVVPSLSSPRLPFQEGSYAPTWVEWGELAGSFGLFSTFYLLFTKFFPVISIWEMKEGRHEAIEEVMGRVKSYLPDTAAPLLPRAAHTEVPS
jgi:molybdopterin-containing oxidoreductase family membrane subunit